ncbi:MAG: phosphate ABC transporter permease PstA [Gammaproteobacteria bacterium]|nr:phosphate ABC transporter permease PstA [Gammaproteobacteria bacterium]
MKKVNIKHWYRSGDPWIWLTAGAVAISMIMVVGLLMLIAVRGLSYFWPSEVYQFDYRNNDGTTSEIVGEIYDTEIVSSARLREAGEPVPAGVTEITRFLIKIGNRDVYGMDFKWLNETQIISRKQSTEAMIAERTEWGNFYGNLQEVRESGKPVASGAGAWQALGERLVRATVIAEEIHKVEKSEIGAINYSLERIRLKQRKHELNGSLTEEIKAELDAERTTLNQEYESLQSKLAGLYKDIGRDSLLATIAGGQQIEIPVSKLVRVWRPNDFGLFDKLGHYFASLWEFVSGEPREANTEGGIFPAIFGTVMMVIIMSFFVTPFGVVAAVYLREYATQGPLTRTIRIAVNNLAGVPSIVYGVFGLGFFVYFLGGNIDQLFFPESLPAPTFGTPGIFWASLTLAILTVPVVIVATEEGLSRIPRNIREGSLALGATKWETLWRTILPMASPAMMTGLILAIARAAGEVAPLMLVGVVKLAPSLPLDGNFPFLHLDRKFMHLGFHIYDVGFQSPNVEAARPLVYATAFLLVMVIILLNLAAIAIRNHLREKYKSFDQ